MTLVSNDESFALGFFSPGTSNNRYLGIWYHNDPMQTVVWVANRVNPINDSTGMLKIESSGRVVLQVQNTTAVWSTNTTASVQNPVLQLLDSGNLVVRDEKDSNPEHYLWQSFDYPSDTMLPGMKIGIDLRTGFQRRLTAWKSWDDPSPGDLTYGVELEGGPEMGLWKGLRKYAMSGLWLGDRFSGIRDVRSNSIYDYNFVWNKKEAYYIFSLKNKSVLSRVVLNQTESVRKRYAWNPENQAWDMFSKRPSDDCDIYGLCGPNGNCDYNKLPICQCLRAFSPKWPEKWKSSDYSGGCIHNKPLNCQTGDGFIPIMRVKSPDITNLQVNKATNLKECEAECSKNCSCMAYTNLDFTRGGDSSCAMWYGGLVDIKQFQSDSDGMKLFIRVSASETEHRKKADVKLALILATVIAAFSGFLLVVSYISRRRRKLQASTTIDTISRSESLTDGKTLVSNGGSFALGFFSPDTSNSNNRYLGIWYHNDPNQTVVWVANRINPINGSTGVLKIESSGKIVLQVQNTTAVWSTNSTVSVEDPVLQLLDSGNLVLRDGNDINPENHLWQSFDYPSDTMLPGMKIGVDLRTSFDRRLSAWKNWDDPSPGDLTYGVELEGSPEMVLMKGLEKYYLTGLWIGSGFSGVRDVRSNPIFDYDFVWNETEIYFTFSLKSKSLMSRVVLNQTESVRKRYTWNPESQTWELFSMRPSDYCDRYGLCGPNGNCDYNKLPVCQCLTGFRPKWPKRWNTSEYSGGCIHIKPLNCQTGDEFITIRRVKSPAITNPWVHKTMNLKECKAECSRNCSCMAYSNLDVTGGDGSGCAMWFGDLVDIKQFQSDSDGMDLYIRVSASETELKKKAKVKLAIILAPVIAALLGLLLVVCYIRGTRRKLEDEVEDKNLEDKENKDENEDMELAVFEFDTIIQATDTFSFRNKLGEGGFGPVYKGTLANGQEIAVKRLSKSSGQGLNEFKNEVKLIAKLQHRNLVRLLGCCIHGEERMLVYEYMPNGSLDSFIFDQTRREELTWYFGMARTFGGDQTEANTNKIVGTYGYMAPEYAIDGLFSIWRLWTEGKPSDAAYEFLAETGDVPELLRSIHISLLCVQQHPEERPSMSSVVLMLGSHNELPSPKQPGFLFYNKPFEAYPSPDNNESSSRNEISSLQTPRDSLIVQLIIKGANFQFILFGAGRRKCPGILFGSVQNPVLLLLDSGNLVVRDENDSSPESYVWQSFDYPSDTSLPGMKVGVDLRTGFDRRLSSRKNWDDPSPGDLTYGVGIEGSPEIVLRKGLEKLSVSGLWNGNGFNGAPNLRSSSIFGYDFVWNENDVYYIFFLKNKSVMSRGVLNETQNARERYTWNAETQTWQLSLILPNGYCDIYGHCGPNGNCDDNKLPACQCLTQFRPKNGPKDGTLRTIREGVYTLSH
ncbi:hypothetical protein V6N11_020956 [Hibiscus sabdariffa]|uniref:non-specific serine/threonine protein kinase n=1 Tax=Hibiscus sabdariffa TaxID=183260 RepID=A0ABR2Q9Z2_9ROSI